MTDAATRRPIVRGILRTDLTSFIGKAFATLNPGQPLEAGWPIRTLAYHLERVRRGDCRRLIINMPPRSLKSISTSVAFPAFLLGHDPTRRIICVSYSNELSYKLANDFRAVIARTWYRELFPSTQVGKVKDSEAEIEFTRRGSRLATSVGGTLTGRGGDFLIIDDPIKPIDALSDSKRDAVNQWFTNTALSRIDNKKSGAIIIVMQRVHVDDLTGFVLSQSDEWEVLSLPAIADADLTYQQTRGETHVRRQGEVLWPAREPLQVLERMRMQLGSALFEAQYQQCPAPPGGAMVKRHWIRRYERAPIGADVFIFQSWDTAAKGGPENDWSVCTTWAQTTDCQWYLLDVWRGRVDYPSLKVKVVELARRWSANTVLVEEAGTAMALIDELRLDVAGIIGIRPEKDKTVRMAIASAKIEAGQVFLPKSAIWLPELEAELFNFPYGRHDDQVDSISQALNYDNGLSVWYRL